MIKIVIKTVICLVVGLPPDTKYSCGMRRSPIVFSRGKVITHALL